MKTSTMVGLIAVVIVVIFGGYWFMRQGSSVKPTYAPTTTVQNTQSTKPTAPSGVSGDTTTSMTHARTSPAQTSPKSQSFSIQASDTKATPTSITVAKGTPVTITFSVDAKSAHGGLDFKSTAVTTGTILPGKSKTVSFTVASSFVLTPYWPSTNTKAPYVISVVVK